MRLVYSLLAGFLALIAIMYVVVTNDKIDSSITRSTHLIISMVEAETKYGKDFALKLAERNVCIDMSALLCVIKWYAEYVNKTKWTPCVFYLYVTDDGAGHTVYRDDLDKRIYTTSLAKPMDFLVTKAVCYPIHKDLWEKYFESIRERNFTKAYLSAIELTSQGLSVFCLVYPVPAKELYEYPWELV